MAVSSSAFHLVVLLSDGRVVAKSPPGMFDGGQGNVSRWHNIVAVSAAMTHTVGLRADGTVIAAGSNEYGQLDVEGWYNIKIPPHA